DRYLGYIGFNCIFHLVAPNKKEKESTGRRRANKPQIPLEIKAGLADFNFYGPAIVLFLHFCCLASYRFTKLGDVCRSFWLDAFVCPNGTSSYDVDRSHSGCADEKSNSTGMGNFYIIAYWP